MIEIGCLARYFNRYRDEVEFAGTNNFCFMQLWYDNEGLRLHEDDKDYIKTIKHYDFPTIIHAVLNIDEFQEHIPGLLEILVELEHKELIIHPVNENKTMNEDALDDLDKNVKLALGILMPHGITVYMENNSKLDPVFMHGFEIKEIFTRNPELEFLLDIAHADSLDHIEEMVSYKKPKMLHIADRRYDIIHEHLPLGEGEIDFEYIFKNMLRDFRGKMILEIVKDDVDIINSRKIIDGLCFSTGITPPDDPFPRML